MKFVRFFVFSVLMFLFVGTGLFAQNVSLDQAVTESAGTIETRLPRGSRVAVLVFTSQAQLFSDYILEELATAISASGKIQVVDRQHMEAVRRELNIQMQGDVSDSEIRRVGQQLGAQYVVTGSLVDVGDVYRFRVAAINVESAVREGSSSINIPIEDPQAVFFLTGRRPPLPPVITNVRFTGANWPLDSNGWRISPVIEDNQTTITRVNFTTTRPDATLVIHLGVSSEVERDYAFVGFLNRAAPAGYTVYDNGRSGYHHWISRDLSRTITIQVPTVGDHFIEIGYKKNDSIHQGADRAWFRLVY